MKRSLGKTALKDEERRRLEQSPAPDHIQPQLATLTDKRFSDPQWIYERKYDGERIVAIVDKRGASLKTRNDKSANAAYPEIVEALRRQAAEDFIVDGEIVAFDGALTSFSRLQQRMQIKSEVAAQESDIAVFYYLFDIVRLDGYCLETLPLRRRKSLLRQVFAFDDPIRFSAHRNGQGEALFEEACKKGWEGVIAKNAQSTYHHKRSRDWLKFKCFKGQEFVIGGYTEPHGDRLGFGALLLGYYDDEGELRYAGRVGTGFDDDELRALHKKFQQLATENSPFHDDVVDKETTWLKPTLVAEIGFTEWTRDGRLRHPRYLGLRRDKAAKSVVREEP